MTGEYRLGVDLGTTYTAAAIERDGRVEVSTLGHRTTMIPSLAVLRPNGEILVGEAAERRAASEPTAVAREFKRRLGDPAPLVLGGVAIAPEALMAALLRHVVALVTTREDRPPARVVLSHPASFGPYKTGLMRRVAELADVPDVALVAEPQAAAISYAQRSAIEPGRVVAVYDFGGGTFDAALVRRTEAGGFDIVGQPEGIERLGGIDLDQLMLEHVLDVAGAGAALDGEPDEATLAALVELRDRCQTAKETLSIDADVRVAVNLPGVSTTVRVTRDELDSMARPRIMETVEVTQRAIRSSGLLTSDIDRVLLVGGSSRIPLVADTVRATLRCPVALDANPKTAICEGAALLDATRSRTRVVAAPPPPSLAAPVPPPPIAAVTAQPPAAPPPAGFEAPSTIRVGSPPKRSRPKWLIPVAAIAAVAAVAGTIAVALGSGGGDGTTLDSSTSVEVGPAATSQRATTTVSVVAATTGAATTATISAATTILDPVAETTAATTVETTTTAAAATIAPSIETTTPVPPPSADEQLTALVDADRAFVIDNMLGGFVVQVNAKFLDQVDDLDGQFYDAQKILDTYGLMEQTHGPVVIVRQDEFNHSEVHPDLFQILLREVFPSREAAKARCDAAGLTIDSCFARSQPLAQA